MIAAAATVGLALAPAAEAEARGRPLRATLSVSGPDSAQWCHWTVEATYWGRLAVDEREVVLMADGVTQASFTETYGASVPSPWIVNLQTNGSSATTSSWTALVILKNAGQEVDRATTRAVASTCN